jgi:hypothetical protein
MVNYLRISSYVTKPFLIYDFVTAPFCISLYMRKILELELRTILAYTCGKGWTGSLDQPIEIVPQP